MDLRQDVPGALDRTGDQLREKCQIQGKFQKIPLGRDRVPVYVYRIAERLEQKKGNAQSQKAAYR